MRVATLLSCVGKDAMDIFDEFSLTVDESNDIDSILGAFENFVLGKPMNPTNGLFLTAEIKKMVNP